MNNADMPAMPITDDMGMPFNALPSEPCTTGLTKREHFAALMMQGTLSNGMSGRTCGEAAQQAVLLADALLAELEKQP